MPISFQSETFRPYKKMSHKKIGDSVKSQLVGSPNYSDITRMAYYVCEMVNRNFNSHSYISFVALKAAAIYAMANVPNTQLI